jgi:hypothetical protein
MMSLCFERSISGFVLTLSRKEGKGHYALHQREGIWETSKKHLSLSTLLPDLRLRGDDNF